MQIDTHTYTQREKERAILEKGETDEDNYSPRRLSGFLSVVPRTKKKKAITSEHEFQTNPRTRTV